MYFSKYKAHYFVVTMFLLSISLPNVKNTVSFLDNIVGALPVQQHSWPLLTATRRRRLTAPNMEPPSPYSSRTEGCREIFFLLDRTFMYSMSDWTPRWVPPRSECLQLRERGTCSTSDWEQATTALALKIPASSGVSSHSTSYGVFWK